MLCVRTSRTPCNDLVRIGELASGMGLFANAGDATWDLKLTDGRRLLIFGNVFYEIDRGGMTIIRPEDGGRIAAAFAGRRLSEAVTRLEGHYVGVLVDDAARAVTFFSDRYARIDTFYARQGDLFVLATGLDFVFEHVDAQYDQTMLAGLFCTYGWYTPKGHTIYANVHQLRVGEALTLNGPDPVSEVTAFKPLEIEDLGKEDLERYYDLLREAIVARTPSTGKIWVSSSSGWDSSLITGMLVNELGPERIGMIAGSMSYSGRTETINKFEIDKITKIGEFYGLTPQRVTLDFESPSAADYWAGVLPWYKSRHCYCYASNNFARLADGLLAAAGPGEIIFNGEASDSFHNFGFSQFGTFFHTVKSFTEYADKMNCYLFGPSFLRKCLDGSYERDKVYQIFRRMNPTVEWDTGDGSREGTIERFLFPFFFGSPRLPLAKTETNPALSPAGRQDVFALPFRTYMPEVLAGLNESNVYSWYVHLYMSFHTQGSTGGVHKHSMDRHGHQWRSPYIDSRLMDLLSRAPERWGRGLDLNHTKFPLKWVARNKIRFPYALLDEGPHSYLYDVIEGFSLFAEITYRSGVTSLFKDTLSSRAYRDLLSDETFDLAYLDALVDGYLDGKEASGADFNVLISLITLSVTGWY